MVTRSDAFFGLQMREISCVICCVDFGGKKKKKKERNEDSWQSIEFYKIDFKFDFVNVL